MIVEDADRFGLAQLHQLRGRVGRGEAQSYCVLVSDSVDETARARLDAVRTTRDGFVLAERDFELRREGDVLGLTQSGLPRLRVASLARREHQDLAVRARRTCGGAARRFRLASADVRRPGDAPGARAERRLAAGDRRGRTRLGRLTAAPRMADAGRVIAGRAAGRRLLAPGPGDEAAGRPREADAVRDPRARPLRSGRARSLRRQRRRRHRGACPAARRGRSSSNAIRARSASSVRTSNGSGSSDADAVVTQVDVLAFLRSDAAASAGPFDIVIVDPPYAESDAPRRRARRSGGPCVVRSAPLAAMRASSRSTSGGTRRRSRSGC